MIVGFARAMGNSSIPNFHAIARKRTSRSITIRSNGQQPSTCLSIKLNFITIRVLWKDLSILVFKGLCNHENLHELSILDKI